MIKNKKLFSPVLAFVMVGHLTTSGAQEFSTGGPLGAANQAGNFVAMSSNVTVYGSFHFTESCTFDPERNLWRNVLIVALEDALGRHALNKNYGYMRSGTTESSRSYFTEPNGDFKMVCTLAGFDHEYIRMKAKQYFNKEKEKNER